MELFTAQPLLSPARVDAPSRTPLRVAAVQARWNLDPAEHEATLLDGIRTAAKAGAKIVFLQELTLSRYMADERPANEPNALAEQLPGGPTHLFAAKAAAETGVTVHASVFEKADGADGPDGLGYNTAILVAPDGTLLARTRKLHIPKTAGYYEDHYFRLGPAAANPYPVIDYNDPLTDGSAKIGLPTCWDQWFPEVARAYALGGAEILAYPTAIGSEPDHPDFDTQHLWQHVIVGHGISNGTFMIVANRWGSEGLITFYGSSFISDPYGRVLVSAPRDRDTVLIADLDLDQRRDWLDLFPSWQPAAPTATQHSPNPSEQNATADGGLPTSTLIRDGNA